MKDELQAAEALVRPARLWTREEVLTRPSPVPAVAGIYAWYFSPLPIEVDTSGCVQVDGWRLLYVGISPSHPRPTAPEPVASSSAAACGSTIAATWPARRCD